MIRRFIEPGNISASGGTKILHGNDTDVSLMTILRVHKDMYVITDMTLNEDTGEAFPTVYKRNLAELTEDFDRQYGAPMQYMKKEDFEWITN